MIPTLLAALIYLLVIGLAFWLALYIISALPLPTPFPQVARVLVTVIACLFAIWILLSLVGGWPRVAPLR